jgi:hypothetical protein
MWRLIREESVAMSTCYPTRVAYNLFNSYLYIYTYIYTYELQRLYILHIIYNILYILYYMYIYRPIYIRQLAEIHSAESGRGCVQSW